MRRQLPLVFIGVLAFALAVGGPPAFGQTQTPPDAEKQLQQQRQQQEQQQQQLQQQEQQRQQQQLQQQEQQRQQQQLQQQEQQRQQQQLQQQEQQRQQQQLQQQEQQRQQQQLQQQEQQRQQRQLQQQEQQRQQQQQQEQQRQLQIQQQRERQQQLQRQPQIQQPQIQQPQRQSPEQQPDRQRLQQQLQSEQEQIQRQRQSQSPPPQRLNTPPAGSVPVPSPAPAGNVAPARGPARPPIEIERRPFTPPPGTVAARASNGSVLNPAGSQAVIGQVNGARGLMRGLNRRPLPQGQVIVHDNGQLTLNAGTRRYEVRASGSLASYHANGVTAAFRPGGRLRSLQTQDMAIRLGWRGGRVIVVHRPDRTVLVSTGPNRGYLERSLFVRNRTLIYRAYVAHGVGWGRYYRPYRYRGLMLPAYMAPVYYPAPFYAWTYNPWSTPVGYEWPWLGLPWFRAYRNYFVPAPYYSNAYLWLTDYVLAETMAAGYEDDSQPGPDASYPAAFLPDDAAAPEDDELYADSDTPITAELRDAIAEELRRQVEAEAAMSGGDQDPNDVDLPASLKPGRLFLVSQSLEAGTTGQQVCELSHGDVLRLIAAPPEDSSAAGLRVVAAKRYDCPAGAQVTVSLQDLQEMQNDLRAQLDAGLAELRNMQGRDGMPAAPRAAMAQPRPDISVAPPAEAGVDALLAAEQRQADQAVTSLEQTAFESAPPEQ